MGQEKNRDFHAIVKNRKLPILTLDARWHDLFPNEAKNAAIRENEQRVNDLLKEQGRLVHDIKDRKKLKTKLLNEIVENMNTGQNGQGKDKKLSKNKQFIEELNGKIEEESDQLADIPYLIKEANEKLMAESIRICYDEMENRSRELEEINEWIKRVREELKLKILAKHDIEEKNNRVYTYMHDVLGPDLIEALDIKYIKRPESE